MTAPLAPRPHSATIKPVPWIDTTEAARRLGVSRARVIVFCREGRIEAEKFGRDWRIDAASLAAFAATPRKVGRRPGYRPPKETGEE